MAASLFRDGYRSSFTSQGIGMRCTRLPCPSRRRTHGRHRGSLLPAVGFCRLSKKDPRRHFLRDCLSGMVARRIDLLLLRSRATNGHDRSLRSSEGKQQNGNLTIDSENDLSRRMPRFRPTSKICNILRATRSGQARRRVAEHSTSCYIPQGPTRGASARLIMSVALTWGKHASEGVASGCQIAESRVRRLKHLPLVASRCRSHVQVRAPSSLPTSSGFPIL
jgi:hypothetical protein